jgi:hypothetical protein
VAALRRPTDLSPTAGRMNLPWPVLNTTEAAVSVCLQAESFVYTSCSGVGQHSATSLIRGCIWRQSCERAVHILSIKVAYSTKGLGLALLLGRSNGMLELEDILAEIWSSRTLTTARKDLSEVTRRRHGQR